MAGGVENHSRGPDRRQSGAAAPDANLPGLDHDERLPWLDADEDELGGAGIDPARVWAFVVGLALLIVMGVGGWWTMHRGDSGAQIADGSLIAAPPGPIKVAPQDPGGKTFAGTGDSSFAVSQGHTPGATLASGGDNVDGAALPTPAAIAGDAGKSAGGVGVQVGAYSTQLAAEGAWAHLAPAYDALAGSAHRVVESKADIGTVYGLQAVTANAGAAVALCEKLKTAGLNCQVKD